MDNLNIWLVTIGEPLPIDNQGRERLYRVGLLSNYLLKAGHKVLWWTSDFYHQKKINRFGKDKTVKLDNGLEIRLLHSVSYYKNVSLKRVINHIHLARKFWFEAEKLSSPDIILASYPPIELCVEAVKYGIKYNIPVVVDVRDLWPDIFPDAVPKVLRPMVHIACIPFYRWAKFVFREAFAIIATTEEYLRWGLKYGTREKSKYDKVFYFGYPVYTPSPRDKEKAIEKLQELGITNESSKFIICLFGSLGWQSNLDPIFESARLLEKNKEIIFILCGKPDKENKFKSLVSSHPNIIFPGWVSKSEIWVLMRYAKIGLAPYIDHKNFLLNLPNKPIEYLSAGLPVLSSINGVLGSFVRKYNCGMIYGSCGKKLAECILRLKNNPVLYETMSQNARKLFEEKFSADRVYPAMGQYLEKVVMDFHKRSQKWKVM